MTLAELKPEDQPTAVLFAVHNGSWAGGRAQFVERSFLVPSELVGKIHALLADYEVGSAATVMVEANRA